MYANRWARPRGEATFMKQQGYHMRSIIFTLSLAFLANSASAGLVLSTEDFTASAPNVSGGVNLGGLASGTTTSFNNGLDELNFQIVIDDSADTGAVFNAVLTLSGTRNNGNSQVRANAAGNIVFSPTTGHQNDVTLTLSGLTQMSGPSATAVFNGFQGATLSLWESATDSFTFDGTSYNGVDDDASLSFSSLAPSGATILDTGTTEWRLQGITSQFTVSASAVPEPSSVAFLVLGIGALPFRRRRRLAS